MEKGYRDEVREALRLAGASERRPASVAELLAYCRLLKTGTDVSTVLSQLHRDGDLERTGRPRDFRYWPVERQREPMSQPEVLPVVAAAKAPPPPPPVRVLQPVAVRKPVEAPEIPVLEKPGKAGAAKVELKPVPKLPVQAPPQWAPQVPDYVAKELRLSSAGAVILAYDAAGGSVSISVPTVLLAILAKVNS